MPETAKRTARVPILGEDGRISDDYVPAAIGEGVESAEAAAKRAETAAKGAQGSATAASQSATKAQESATAADNAKAAADTAQKGAESAKTAAEAAKEAAEAAKTGAETARGSAQTAASKAQQSATAAAESAESVADKFIASAQATTLEPGSQATASVESQVLTIGVPKGEKGDKGDQGEKGDTGTGVPDGGEPGQLLSKTADGTAWIDPPSGNVLTGEAEGYVAHADDAYAQKPRDVRIKGRTVQNLWSNPSGTNNGVTVTSNADGSITLSGTATQRVFLSLASYILRPGSTYTVESDKKVSDSWVVGEAGTGAGFGVVYRNAENVSQGQTLFGYGSVLVKTFAVSSAATHVDFTVIVEEGFTVSGTYRVMLNEGSTAEPWCPPGLNSVGDGGSVDIVTAGKNLLDIPDTQKITDYGGTYTFTLGDDGSVTCSPTPDQRAWSYKAANVKMLLPAGTYTLSLSISEYVPGCGIRAYKSDEKLITQLGIYDETHVFGSFTLDAPTEVGIMYKMATVKGYPQLELGSTATAYEPPTVTTTPIDLDGNTLCSLPDGTHDELTIDATGAVTLTKRTEQKTIDAEHPISVDNFIPASGTNLPYVIVSNIFAPFDSIDSGISKTIFSTSWPYTENVKSRGVYRTWNATIFVDERFTDKETAKSIINETGGTFVAQVPSSTEPLSPVTLPTLPAPTVNVWADAEASGAGYAMDTDVELEYERDVTIAFNKLQAQISATTVREATNG